MKRLDRNIFKVELKRILGFWMTDMVDDSNDGFYGRIDGNDQLHADAPKGLVLNSRILWTFSSAYLLDPRDEYMQHAKRAYQYLINNFVDTHSGGMYWLIDHQGNPIDNKKQIYAQAFAIYALSEYYKISKDKIVLDLAMQLFELIEQHSFDTDKNGYFEAFSQDWVLLEDLRLSDKDANEVKTMNSHLHILEAYSNLLKVSKDTRVEKQLENLLELFVDKFLDTTYQYNLFFDENWNSKSKEVSYGHDIEAAWLLDEAAVTLNDPTLMIKTKELAVKTAEATLPFFDVDGGLFYSGEPGKIVDKDKHWWPQAEALIGLFNAYQVSGDKKFLDMTVKCWDYTEKNILDFEHGEWVWGIKSDGSVMDQEDKAGMWKCPYHNGRAMIEMIRRL